MNGKGEVRRLTLGVEGYRADVTHLDVTVTAEGRTFDQRDERSQQGQLLVPIGEARRVAGLLTEAADAAESLKMVPTP